jgi:uncharacterized caspase-like protein
MYKGAEVTRLLDSEATVPRIRAALEAIQKRATRADTVIDYLSGHGVEDKDGTYYFATHEVNPTNLPKTGLPAALLQTLLGSKLQAKRVFVFADTCHSGRIPARAASNDRLSTRGMVVLASSQGGEYSFEKEEWGHGAFTLALLEAFQGKADPKAPVLTFRKLEAYVSERVEELTGAQQQVVVSAEGFPFGTPVAQRSGSAGG